jgi:glycosyltransferase involved in cell wall biosynthesis
VQELAARLAELARDPELRVRMGAAGRERMRTRYAVDRLVDDVDRLYRELLERRGIDTSALSAVGAETR